MPRSSRWEAACGRSRSAIGRYSTATPSTICHSGRGQVLAPWPNRIAGGEYSFDGDDYRLALTEPDAGNAGSMGSSAG